MLYREDTGTLSINIRWMFDIKSGSMFHGKLHGKNWVQLDGLYHYPSHNEWEIHGNPSLGIPFTDGNYVSCGRNLAIIPANMSMPSAKTCALLPWTLFPLLRTFPHYHSLLQRFGELIYRWNKECARNTFWVPRRLHEASAVRALSLPRDHLTVSPR